MDRVALHILCRELEDEKLDASFPIWIEHFEQAVPGYLPSPEAEP